MTESEKAPSKDDVEAQYDQVFGPPALDTVKEKEESEPMDEADSFGRVYEVAKRRPWVALRAVYAGVATHFRGEGPFDYSVDASRRGGEVSQ